MVSRTAFKYVILSIVLISSMHPLSRGTSESGEKVIPVVALSFPSCPIRLQMAYGDTKILDPQLPEGSMDPHAGKLQYSIQIKNETEETIRAGVFLYEASVGEASNKKSFRIKLKNPLFPSNSEILRFWSSPVVPVELEGAVYFLYVERVIFENGEEKSCWIPPDDLLFENEKYLDGDPMLDLLVANELDEVYENAYFGAVFEARHKSRCQGPEPTARCSVSATIIRFLGGTLPASCDPSEDCAIELNIGSRAEQSFKIKKRRWFLSLAVLSSADGGGYHSRFMSMSTDAEEVLDLRMALLTFQKKSIDTAPELLLAEALKDVPEEAYIAAVFEARRRSRCRGRGPTARCSVPANILKFLGGTLPSSCASSEDCLIELDIGPKSEQKFLIEQRDLFHALAVLALGEEPGYHARLLSRFVSLDEIVDFNEALQAVQKKSGIRGDGVEATALLAQLTQESVHTADKGWGEGHSEDPFTSSLLALTLQGLPPSMYFAAVFDGEPKPRCEGDDDASRCYMPSTISDLVWGEFPDRCVSHQECAIEIDFGPRSGQVFQVGQGKRHRTAANHLLLLV